MQKMSWSLSHRFHNLKNLKGWFKLTLIKGSYYITVSVTFFNSLVNIPRTRDSLIQCWVQTGGILLIPSPTTPPPPAQKKVLPWS